MFTGLVETMGTVAEVRPDGHGGSVLRVHAPLIASALTIGESVAVNGACLTVVEFDDDSFQFQCGPETLLRTNLGQLIPGAGVNLERSLRIGDRLGGHFVQGHVDGVGLVERREQSGEWEMVRFGCDTALTLQMVAKGSITIDGISLTLVEVNDHGFMVMLIPHTLAVTTLGSKGVGDRVNLETDILAKHLQRMLHAFQERR